MGIIDRSTVWPYEHGEPGRFSYARAEHPTGVGAEAVLGELEGGRALLFGSGMAAATTVLLTLGGPGATIALAEGAYYGTAVLFRQLAPWGVDVVEFDQTGPPPADAARVSCFLRDHPRWSAYWDKKHGLWRVAEDDPDSDLYAESSDADTVIGYITAHS